MANSQGPSRPLPANPSQENLRKQAKRLAKAQDLRLADGQRQLAADYGYPNWAALMRAVREASPGAADAELSGLSAAAARADETAVCKLLVDGVSVEGDKGERSTPLWHVCASDAPEAQRIAVASLLLQSGASPRSNSEGGATPLHAAARRGPLALVELLIRGGALSWQADAKGKAPLDYARKGKAADRKDIIELLDRPVIRDARFRAAVRAIHGGDVEGLGRLLDQHPGLLSERAVEPDCYPRDYFRDPKLFWFVANNPTLMPKVPDRIGDVARVIIARGVPQADLDYTLELVISNSDEIMGGHQVEMIGILLAAGAKASPRAIEVALAHFAIGAVQALLDAGLAMTAPIAAAFGQNDELARRLPHASAEDRQMAFGLAVINRRLDAARLCLDAGADVNAYLPVHKHSQPMHQAAVNDDVPMLKLLVARGARTDTRDTLWDGTPLGWAAHNKKADAEAYLRSLLRPTQRG